jgi:hypothetical protein
MGPLESFQYKRVENLNSFLRVSCSFADIKPQPSAYTAAMNLKYQMRYHIGASGTKYSVESRCLCIIREKVRCQPENGEVASDLVPKYLAFDLQNLVELG